MFLDNDLLQLTAKGNNILGRKYLSTDEFLVSKYFADNSDTVDFFVLTNITQWPKRAEPIKPLIFGMDDAHGLFTHCLDKEGCGRFHQYHVVTLLDEQTLASHYNLWKAKRDEAFSIIEPFTDSINIWRYLRGELGKDIKVRATTLKVNHKAIRRALNRYISLGCVKNALLPVRYENSGNAPRNYKQKPGHKLRPDGMPVLSESRVIQHKDGPIIRRLAMSYAVEKVDGKFSLTHLHTKFKQYYCSAPGYENINGKQVPTLIFDEKKSLTYQQFIRAFNRVFSDDEKIILREGRAYYERQRRDKTGSAREGIWRAGQMCEIDSTPLPIYVAYPLDNTKRESAGKVYLCLVGCVSTQYIMGYSLSFAPPIWGNVAEALFNCAEDKQVYASKYGLEIANGDWISQQIPEGLRLDNGAENVVEIIRKVIEARIGINSVDICGPDQPSMKGTIENLLSIIQQFLARAPGTVVKYSDKTKQHASQLALLKLEDIHRLIIKAICIHNSTASREKLLSQEMASDDVNFVPSAMWTYSMNHPMHGRPKLSQDRLPTYFWALLRKHKGSVTSRGLRFEKREYWSQWASNEKWFTKAACTGVYPMEMVMFGGDVNHLYFKDENGSLQTFSLTRDYDQFKNMTRQQAQQRQAEIDVRKKENKLKKVQAEVNYQVSMELYAENAKTFYRGVPLNESKSIQKTVKENNLIMREEEQKDRARRYREMLEPSDENESDFVGENFQLDASDYDEEGIS